MDACADHIDDAAMDREGVIERWRGIEREYVIGWCGASAADRPGQALRELVAKQKAAEGGHYEVPITQVDRVIQTLILETCKRYGLRPFRRKGQRRRTIVVAGPETFMEKVYVPMLERGIQAVMAGVDTWLEVIVDACIREDLPGEQSQAASSSSAAGSSSESDETT